MNKSQRKPVASKKPVAAAAAAGKRKMTTKKKMSPKKKIIKKISPVTLAKRNGSHAVDAQGRVLPVDYESAHLHDPYDYFFADTSKIFDEHPHLDALKTRFPTKMSRVIAHKAQNDLILDQIAEVRSNIKCSKELDAFENVLVPTLNPKQDVLNHAEVQYALEKRGFTNIQQITEPIENSWSDFILNDFKSGRCTTSEKMMTIANHALMWTSAATLAYIGVDACVQYYYDLEYPLHHH